MKLCMTQASFNMSAAGHNRPRSGSAPWVRRVPELLPGHNNGDDAEQGQGTNRDYHCIIPLEVAAADPRMSPRVRLSSASPGPH